MVGQTAVLTVGPAVLVLLTACGGNDTTPSPTLSSLAVSCDSTLLGTIGQQAHCQARTTLSDSTVQDQTASAQWSSSDSSKVSVAAGGVVTAVAAGTANVTATAQGLTARQAITVSLTCAFSISPATLSFSSRGGSQAVTVTATPAGCGPSTWTASTTDGGITLAPAGGDGSGSVTVNAAANSGPEQTLHATIAGQPLTVSVAAAPAPAPSPTHTLALTLIQGEHLSGPYAGTATTSGGYSCTLTQVDESVTCAALTVQDGTSVVFTVALAPQLAGVGHPIRPSTTRGCDVITETTCQVLMNRDRSVTIAIGWDVSPLSVANGLGGRLLRSGNTQAALEVLDDDVRSAARRPRQRERSRRTSGT